ncbi:DUF3007 family protein [Leptothoe sp. PORK10 BA2]|uniref:DUF3007 family protein n=1 Tax=Leptothoe sp. PORK10 BA2 TaxID=3110254 RepID=UPI002B212A9F|nr:DUF3007 family protein [Leptothoe sp. PORK10 BA2]MEA5462461.1 DUF3007 family protein [Leptothoe sp. PORK10 BA2]
MRRIDVIGIGLGVFVAGGAVYLALTLAGLDGISAGIWSQVIFTGGLVGWVLTYITRVFSQKMTYNQQLKDYEDAVLQKRLDEMTNEEIAQLQVELEAEKKSQSAS